MQQSFHLFIQRHVNDWYTASVLTHPSYAVFGPKLGPMREELREVLAQEMSSGALTVLGETYFEDLRQKQLELELRAVQRDRLVQVPMRFTVLYRPLEEEDHFEVQLPRLRKTFRIYREENILPWAEEIVRGFFHLSDVERLLDYQYERGARIERLDVTWHGGQKLRRVTRSIRGTDTDIFAPWRSPLAEIGVELTEEARQGRLGKTHHRDGLVNEVMSILAGGTHHSLLLVGPSGVGKTAILHEVAGRIAQGRVPARLLEIPVWHVTGGRIIAGMKYLGQWQERARAVVEEIRSERGILYVDSLLELMMSGSSQTGLNVASFLLPFVRSGELTVVAEATPDALVLAEQLGAPFVHALRRVPVPPFSTEEAYDILSLHTRQLGREYKVEFSPPSLHRALDVLARFGDADALPGSGLALIEQMARLAPTPAPGGKRTVLGPGSAIEAFSRASGFPEALIDPDQLLEVGKVKDFFEERVIGQRHATELLTNLVTLIKASLNDPSRPLGSFLFMGPTGVGKTESALTLAEYLFGNRARLVRFDMSEYGYPGAGARLVGGARGEGELTRRVREQPFSVLLFDEVEKADGEVFDLLLQVLGEGRLTDGTGRTVRFGHTIVIMTSNLGAARKAPIGLSRAPELDESNREEAERHYMDAAQRFFRPEFINRVDFIVPFASLGAGQVRAIARGMLERGLNREGFSRRNITVDYDAALIDLLMEHGFDPRYGARPMKRAIDQHVLIPMSRRLARRSRRQDEERFTLYVHEGRVAVVSDRGLTGAPAPRSEGPALDHNNLWRRYLLGVRQRLQDWEESALVRALVEQQRAELPARLDALGEPLRALEEAMGLGPEEHPPERLEALTAQARALDEAVARVEWALCLESLGGQERAELHIEPRSAHPAASRRASELAERLLVWARRHGFEAQRRGQGAGHRLTLVGVGAEVVAACEEGLHRFHDGGEPLEVLVWREGREVPQEPGVVREVTPDPATVWDPVTELELPVGFEALSDHLERLLLARLCAQVAQK